MGYICKVQFVRQISALFLAATFFMLSSGFIMYKSFCSCSGNEQVSVFVENEVCATTQYIVCCGDAITLCCANEQSNECRCYSSEITYVKLLEQVVNKEVEVLLLEPVLLKNLFAVTIDVVVEKSTTADCIAYTDPPPLIASTQEFIIEIQQLKLPYKA